MRRTIHGWMLGLILFGAGCLGIAARAASDPPTSEQKRVPDSANESSFAPLSVPSSSARRNPPDWLQRLPAPTPKNVPNWTVPPSHSGATVESPAESSGVKLLQPLEVPLKSALKSSPVKSDARLRPVIQTGHGLSESGQFESVATMQAAPAERRPVSQLARQVYSGGGSSPQQPGDAVRRGVQQPGQQPDSAQVRSFIGQVDVQAIDPLGVVILRGNPQDVEDMKKIIEEIQKISEAVEPYVQHWHLQDLVLVTMDGPQLLSDRFQTDEMFVIE